MKLKVSVARYSKACRAKHSKKSVLGTEVVSLNLSHGQIYIFFFLFLLLNITISFLHGLGRIFFQSSVDGFGG